MPVKVLSTLSWLTLRAARLSRAGTARRFASCLPSLARLPDAAWFHRHRAQVRGLPLRRGGPACRGGSRPGDLDGGIVGPDRPRAVGLRALLIYLLFPNIPGVRGQRPRGLRLREAIPC